MVDKNDHTVWLITRRICPLSLFPEAANEDAI